MCFFKHINTIEKILNKTNNYHSIKSSFLRIILNKRWLIAKAKKIQLKKEIEEEAKLQERVNKKVEQLLDEEATEKEKKKEDSAKKRKKKDNK